MSAGKKLAVLAFSGGLDTSYCVLDLINRGYDVVTVFAYSEGSADVEVGAIEQRALELGAIEHRCVDIGDQLWKKFVVPLVHSGARAGDQYPLLCSDRYLIVSACLEICDELNTRVFAHGCTGMGNDQLRFDQSVRSLGHYQIIAPIRELQTAGRNVREFEIAALQQAGFEVNLANRKYSVNENLLGVTISGSEIDQFEAPAADTHVLSAPRKDWPDLEYAAEIHFENGVAVGLDSSDLSGVALLSELNQSFGKYGVGRHIYTGDVTIGLKGRIVFECPGIDVLMLAQKALRETVFSRFQNQYHSHIAQRWCELVYSGFFFEPHKRDLDAYLASSMQSVTGSVTVATQGGVANAVAVRSPHILCGKTAVYAQSADWSASEAEGFVKLIGQSSTMAANCQLPAGGVQ